MKKYYNLVQYENSADLYIYGDITSMPWSEDDVSAYNLVQELDGITAETIRVYINSYGGEVKEGFAIYNALKRHPARITTYCDGFACSAASVVFMAGDDRVTYDTSMLMIHNAWTYAAGNAGELRKEADDLEKISEVAAEAYRKVVSISDDELSALLEAETWITPAEALEWGFATSIEATPKAAGASMNARKAVFAAVKKQELQATEPPRAELEEPPEPANNLQGFLAKLCAR